MKKMRNKRIKVKVNLCMLTQTRIHKRGMIQQEEEAEEVVLDTEVEAAGDMDINRVEAINYHKKEMHRG